MSERFVVVDTLCETTREAKPTPELRAWLRGLCTDDGKCKPGVPPDVQAWVRTIAANNKIWRERCAGGQPAAK